MFSVIVHLTVGCHKNGNAGINISGYTATDEQGNVLWSVSHDTTDWRINQVLPTQIQTALNALPLNTDTTHYPPGSIVEMQDTGYIGGAYPNPNMGTFVFYQTRNASGPYACKYALVDDMLHIYNSGVIAGNGNVTISMTSVPSGLYRLYYSYYDGEGNVLTCGFGDIKKQ